MTSKRAIWVLVPLTFACGDPREPVRPVPPTAGAAMELRSKALVNQAAYTPSSCWTKTQDEDGTVHNPCFACHTRSLEPNYSNDQGLQLTYQFPAYTRENRWPNLFKSRAAAMAAISDDEILRHVRTSNYVDSAKRFPLADLLRDVPEGWDANENGVWDGYTPDAYFSFDGQGFDRSPGGGYTGWRAFAYAPFPGTFWPTNGSTDDILIRLAAAFRNDANGRFDRTIYTLNLAIVEALVTRRDVAIDPVDEAPIGVDLDKDGVLGTAMTIRFDWAPLEGRTMSFVGKAGHEQAAGGVHLAAGLYPEGTELLHTVRYVDVTDGGAIAMAARLKELRYARKASWRTYPQLSMAADAELKEKHDFPDRLSVFLGDVEHGLSNDQGWVYQGFIEDSGGDLRPQTYEETLACMGCHSGLGVTTDGTFALPRKLPSSFQRGWYHWTQKGLAGTPEPKIETDLAGVRGEYSFYLMYNRAGDELRANTEVQGAFFDEDGVVKPEMLKALSDDVTVLLDPSPERALLLDKAYRTIVAEQSYIEGRDATLAPAVNVHDRVDEEQATGVTEAVSTVRSLPRFNADRIAADHTPPLPATTPANQAAVAGAGMSGPDGTAYGVASDGLIYRSSYSVPGVFFPFPDRLTLPVQTIVPLQTIASCYVCHRIDYAVPAANLAGRALYIAPVVGGTEGGMLTRLTDSPERDLQPRWSPDGTRLAWVSGPAEAAHVFVMDADGRNQRQVTSGVAIQGWPEWSPDGTRLVYWEQAAATQTYAIRTVLVDGTGVVTLAEGAAPLDRPTWRPDGRYIAYAEERSGNWDVWVASSDGSQRWQLTRAAEMQTNPLWSPDGNTIAYKRAALTGTYTLTENHLLDVRAGFDAPVAYDWDGPQSIQMSAWSPDGTKIAYTAEAVSSNSGRDRVSYLVALSDVTRSGGTAHASHTRVLSAITLGDRGAVFSPDGKRIAFWGWDPSYRAVLWIHDVASGRTRRLTTEGFDRHPQFSPDGTKLAFESNRGGSADIWVLDLPLDR